MSDNNVRTGCHDIWKAFMVSGAIFSEQDIPFCPNTATSIPLRLISYVSAQSIYKKAMKEGNSHFHFLQEKLLMLQNYLKYNSINSEKY